MEILTSNIPAISFCNHYYFKFNYNILSNDAIKCFISRKIHTHTHTKATQYPIVAFEILMILERKERKLYLKEVYLTCLKDL